MIKKISLLFLVLALTGGQWIGAQSTTISNVLNMKSAQQSGNILENDKIVGYYIFYFKEKKSKTISAYEVELFDDNYNSVKSFEIERPKKSVMLQMAYNQEMFLLTFYNLKTGFEFITYNREGDIQGTKKIDASEIDRKTLLRKGYGTFHAKGSTGFVRTWGNEIIGYNNNLEEEWTYEAEIIGKKGITTAGITSITDDYIIASAYKKKSLMTKKLDVDVLLIDAKSGDLIKTLEMGNLETGKKSVLRADYIEKSNMILIVGEYFKPGDDMLKDMSEGLFIQELDKSGKISRTEMYSWEKDIDEFKNDQLSKEELAELKKRFSLMFHDVIIGKNGHIYMIAEQFKKQVSALGVAGKLLSGGDSQAAAFEIRIGNMVLLEFDDKYKMVDFKVVSKKKSSVMLPSGAGLYGPAFLGYYVKGTGGFDYSFTSRDVENDIYDVVYTDLDRKGEEKGQKADRMLGVIRIAEGEIDANRVAINTDAKHWWLRAAKPGYISIFEYSRKVKELTIRLEQISY
ncbi:MAG: hypothetical protein COA38_09620 [Fluviicola sp.]|nr:MAG: hypothetical protein COA38_09620 [Fluviicola sp.]